MNRKGQLSIEIIILLAIFLLFFQAMILPSIEFSENVLQDTQAIVMSKKSVEDLAINIEQLASQDGYGRRQYYFNLPRNTVLECKPGNILDYNITISKQQPSPQHCKDGVCNQFERAVFLPSTKTLSCEKIGPGFTGVLIIEKEENGYITLTRG